MHSRKFRFLEILLGIILIFGSLRFDSLISAGQSRGNNECFSVVFLDCANTEQYISVDIVLYS